MNFMLFPMRIYAFTSISFIVVSFDRDQERSCFPFFNQENWEKLNSDGPISNTDLPLVC